MAQPDTGGAIESLAPWLRKIVDYYNSHASSQFILTGNIHDLFASTAGKDLVALPELLMQAIVPRYNVVLSFDIGSGLRVERGTDVFGKWGEKPEMSSKEPRAAIELITYYLRFVANVARLGQTRIRVAVLLKDAQLFANNSNLSADALSFLIREWSRDPLLTGHDIVSFVLSESLSDLHPLIRQNPQAAHVSVPLPAADDVRTALVHLAGTYRYALRDLGVGMPEAGAQLAGTTLLSILSLLKLKEHQKASLCFEDLARSKAGLIEKECPGLLELLPPRNNLDQLHGQQALKEHLRQNIALWKQNRPELIPMGYLVCGPVGTGKTFLVRCLAGEANVPVVVLKNFRDKWYGSTESNLEKIFRTIRAIGRCYVFIDEADQSLGRRDSSGSEPAVSGRIYSMVAQEMSNPENRGSVVWILATSRPDLLEVDLKRPGRIDLKIPLFPASSPEEAFELLQVIAKHRDVNLPSTAFADVRECLPDLLTPGEAESLVTELKREMVVTGKDAVTLLLERLRNHQPAVPHDTMMHQVRLAVRECSRLEYVPPRFRELKSV